MYQGNEKIPRFGDIYLARFNGTDSEQNGLRPAVIFQNNVGNLYSPNVVVLPISSRIKKTKQPTHVVIPAEDTGLQKDSMVLCENPMCMSKNKLIRYVTRLPDKYMARIAEANLLASSAISCIDPDLLLTVWERADRMNR